MATMATDLLLLWLILLLLLLQLLLLMLMLMLLVVLLLLLLLLLLLDAPIVFPPAPVASAPSTSPTILSIPDAPARTGNNESMPSPIVQPLSPRYLHLSLSAEHHILKDLVTQI